MSYTATQAPGACPAKFLCSLAVGVFIRTVTVSFRTQIHSADTTSHIYITYDTYVESYGTIDGARAPPRHAYAGASARMACASYARARAYATATPRAAA